jgi:prepilin-type N-terminal cleavage/methylation domain-containing protein
MSRRGFTLLELLIAITLAGVLSAIALPSVQRQVERWRIGAAARQVVMDLKAARARAIAGGAAERIHFAVASATYQLERQRPGGAYAAIAPATRLPDGVRVVDCTAAGDGVGFRPRGYAITFGTITLRNASGDERRVIVDIAGRLRVQ